MGLIREIGNALQDLVALADEEDQLKVAIVALIWISALVSSFLDNIPYTATMVLYYRQHHLLRRLKHWLDWCRALFAP